MRARFSAFATGNSEFLLTSWHRTTRPKAIDLDPLMHWYRLDIERTEDGGLLDDSGVVAFRAFYHHSGGNGEQAETSLFLREKKQWFYLSDQ